MGKFSVRGLHAIVKKDTINSVVLMIIGAVIGAILSNAPILFDKNNNNLLKKANSYYWDGDYENAYSVYKKLEKRGVPQAFCNLGVLYENGCYVDKNCEEAFRCYKSSFEQGCEKAKRNYIMLALRTQSHRDELIQIMKQAYQNKDYDILSCAISCIKNQTIDEDTIRTTHDYDIYLSSIDDYFPALENIDVIENTIITSKSQLSEYKNAVSSRERVQISCNARGCTYTYSQTVNREYIFSNCLRHGIADWNE